MLVQQTEAIVFYRTTRVRRGGKEYIYGSVVKAVRVNGKPRQEMIAALGRVIESVSETDRAELLRVLRKWAGEPEARKAGAAPVAAGAVDPDLGEYRSYGDIVAIERAWEAVGLADIFRALARERHCRFDLERAVFSMVANRLADPRSKYGTAEWLYRDVYLPTGVPLDADELYDALTWLAGVQGEAELMLYRALVGSNRIDATVVFYDTSMFWFEGRGPEGLAERGRSKGTHPPNRRLILLGLIRSLNGWPIAHRVFAGNTADVTTLEPMLRDLVDRFGVRRFVFICDRGMISEEVIDLFENKLKVDYIIATKLRADAEVKDKVLSRAGRFSEKDEQLGVKEVYCDGRRYVVCRNLVEVEADAKRRAEILETLRTKHLNRPCRATTKRAKKLVVSGTFGRYLSEVGGFLAIDPKKVVRDERYDGKWVLRTNLSSAQASTEEVARLYRQEVSIEHDFRDLKSFIELRPIFHRLEPRVRAHVFICVLAKVVARELETRLHRSGFVGTSVEAVLDELARLQVTEVNSPEGRRFVRRRPTTEQEDLLRRLDIDPASLPWRLPTYELQRPRRTRLDNVEAERRRQARKRKRHEAWLGAQAARTRRRTE